MLPCVREHCLILFFKEVAIEREFKIYPQDDSESPKDLAGNCESWKTSRKHLDNFPPKNIP